MFKIIFAACVLCAGLFVPVYGVYASDAQSMAWVEPELDNPDVYSIYAVDDNLIALQRNQDDPTYFPEDEQVEITLAYDKDVVVVLPEKPLDIASLRIHHGRHVVVRGGHLRAVKPADKTMRGLLWAGGTRGALYVENMILDTTYKDGLDALLVGGYGNQSKDTYPDVYIRNVRMTGVENSDGNPFHADCFQYYGPTNITYMHGVDCETNTQGFFLAPQHHVGGISLNHVSITYLNPERANGYALYLKDKVDDARVPIIFNDVYVGRRDTDFGYGHDGKWEVYSIFPHALLEHGLRREGDAVKFPFYSEIEGSVFLHQGDRFFKSRPE